MAAAAAASLTPALAPGTAAGRPDVNGGRFDFDDGGTYCGGWVDGKAHGHGVCTGPKGQGEYAGSWQDGFEVSGVYTWPSGSTYEGHWQNGKRHGLGVEARGRWLYRGEWTTGFRGRYGVRQSTVSAAKYEGTWANGLQDGYGSETYADGGTYQGQWLRGMRHGYGVRTSAPYGLASHHRAGSSLDHAVSGSQASLVGAGAGASAASASSPGASGGASDSKRAAGGTADAADAEETRGGFVLRARSDEVPHRRRSLVERSGMKTFVQGLKLKKQRSTGDLDRKGVTSVRSTGSTNSWMSNESGYMGMSVRSAGSNQSFIMEEEHLDPSVTETYMGEWKNDKRSGFGISERSDGLKYEGEWYNNRKYGYGVTTFRDGTKEEGKYKNNILVTSNTKRHLFLMRSAKLRERIDSAVNAALRASKIALQKADIAISRTATARGKAEQADVSAWGAREDAKAAVGCAKQYSADLDIPSMRKSDEKAAKEAEEARQKQMPLGKSSAIQSNRVASAMSPPSTAMATANKVENAWGAQAMGNSHHAKPVSGAQQQQQQQQLHNRSQSQSRLQAQTSVPSPSSDTVDSFAQRQQQQQPVAPALGVKKAAAGGGGGLASIMSSAFASGPPSVRPPAASNSTDNISSMGFMSGRPPEAAAAVGGGADRRFLEKMTNCDSTTTNGGAALTRPATAPSRPAAAAQTAAKPRSLSQQPRPSAPSAPQQSASAEGEFSFQRIMDDHFDHYRRPPSRPASREPSVDRLPLAAVAPSSSSSRPPSRPQSRARGGHGHTNGDLGDDGGGGVRHRGHGHHIPAQYVNSLSSAAPKRTESLYMKPSEQQAQTKDAAGSTQLQRKKSLPDVQVLEQVTASTGSREMTREEISVLSSSRRDAVRRQMEEADRAKANPFLYVFNPRVQEWIYRQRLMLLVLFVNMSLAFMFFKLLT